MTSAARTAALLGGALLASACAAAIEEGSGGFPSAIHQKVAAGAIERAVGRSGIGRRPLAGERVGLRVVGLRSDAATEDYLRSALRKELLRAGATVVDPDEANLLLEVKVPVAGIDASGERGILAWAACPFFCSEWIAGEAALDYFLYRSVEGSLVAEGRGRGESVYRRFTVFFWLLGPFEWDDTGFDGTP